MRHEDLFYSFLLFFNTNIIIGYLLNNNDSTQMISIAVFARLVVDLNLRGKQIAYQRSTDMNVSVSTDTVTDTDCNKRKLCLFKTSEQRSPRGFDRLYYKIIYEPTSESGGGYQFACLFYACYLITFDWLNRF